jgi:hypothetical protein
LDFDYIRVLGLQLFNQDLRRVPGPEGRATGKDIGCGVPVLRPGMYRDVRLGNGKNTGYSLGTELVEGLANYMSA